MKITFSVTRFIMSLIYLTTAWLAVFIACVVWYSASAAAIKFLLWAGLLL